MFDSEKVLLDLACEIHLGVSCFLYPLEICCLALCVSNAPTLIYVRHHVLGLFSPNGLDGPLSPRLRPQFYF